MLPHCLTQYNINIYILCCRDRIICIFINKRILYNAIERFEYVHAYNIIDVLHEEINIAHISEPVLMPRSCEFMIREFLCKYIFLGNYK